VDDVPAVGRGHGVADLEVEAESLGQVQIPPGLGQDRTVHPLHDHVPVGIRPSDLIDVGDVGVVEPAHEPGLVPLVQALVLSEELDRDLPVQDRVYGLKDRTDLAAADPADDPVSRAQEDLGLVQAQDGLCACDLRGGRFVRLGLSEPGQELAVGLGPANRLPAVRA